MPTPHHLALVFGFRSMYPSSLWRIHVRVVVYGVTDGHLRHVHAHTPRQQRQEQEEQEEQGKRGEGKCIKTQRTAQCKRPTFPQAKGRNRVWALAPYVGQPTTLWAMKHLDWVTFLDTPMLLPPAVQQGCDDGTGCARSHGRTGVGRTAWGGGGWGTEHTTSTW